MLFNMLKNKTKNTHTHKQKQTKKKQNKNNTFVLNEELGPINQEKIRFIISHY